MYVAFVLFIWYILVKLFAFACGLFCVLYFGFRVLDLLGALVLGGLRPILDCLFTAYAGSFVWVIRCVVVLHLE